QRKLVVRGEDGARQPLPGELAAHLETARRRPVRVDRWRDGDPGVLELAAPTEVALLSVEPVPGPPHVHDLAMPLLDEVARREPGPELLVHRDRMELLASRLSRGDRHDR